MLIRMMENFLTFPTFKRGLANYFKVRDIVRTQDTAILEFYDF